MQRLNPYRFFVRFVCIFSLSFCTFAVRAEDLFVSTKGSDDNGDGTMARPFKTLFKARDVSAELAENQSEDIVINIRGGVYHLTEAFIIRPEHSGHNGHMIIYQPYENENVIVCGGVLVTDWEKVSGQNYWKAPLDIEYGYEFSVDGVWRERAHTENFITVKRWDRGPVVDGSSLPTLTNVQDIDMSLTSHWRSYFYMVESVVQSGSDKVLRLNQTILDSTNLYPPYAYPDPASEDRETPRKIKVRNAIELLNQPGEYYYDRTGKTIYYYPESGEDMSEVRAYAGVAEVLLKILGRGENEKVSNITVRGIMFTDATWNRPAIERGWFGQQGDWPRFPKEIDAPQPMVTPGAIQISDADNVRFEDCTVRNTHSVGIGVYKNTTGIYVIGNRIYDTGAGGITIGSGSADHSQDGVYVENNVIRRTGRINMGSPGIQGFYVNGVDIIHNDLEDLPFTGIAIGWGWPGFFDFLNGADNRVNFNRVVNHMQIVYDGGGVYTLGPGSASITGTFEIKSNYLKDNHNKYGALFIDEGAYHWHVEGNVVENAPSWIHMWSSSIKYITVLNNWSNVRSSLNNATESTMEEAHFFDANNKPQEVLDIWDASGVEPEYKHVLDFDWEWPTEIRSEHSGMVSQRASFINGIHSIAVNNGRLNVRLDRPAEEPFSLDVLNSAGQVVQSVRGDAARGIRTVGITAPADGVYVVRYVSGPVTRTKQVTVIGR
jgi:hypothetical protein